MSLVSLRFPSLATGEPPGDWPQWRGPQRNGHCPGPAWPDRLSAESLQEGWRIPLSESYSGPIVAEDRVFTTETRDRKFEVVRAVDRTTGETLWKAQWEGALRVPFFAAANGSWIRSTPAYDGQSLFVAGMRDVLVCLDARNGDQRWRVDFVQQFDTPLPPFGFVCSPLVAGDHVYVQAAASFVKLEKATGKVVWRTAQDAGGMFGSAFSSPMLANLGGRQQLVVQTRRSLKGIDEQTGEELWSRPIEAFRGMNILTPTPHGSAIFTSAHSGKTQLWKIVHRDDRFAVEEAWSLPAQGYMSSPVIIAGHAYLHLRNQRFACIDLASGREKWRTRPYGKYWSLVARGDRILALDERGDLLLIRANPEKFQLLGSVPLSDDPTWAHLAVSGSQLFVRELKALVAYTWQSP
ncbi:MAG: PQQ-binding-like beta-propeller repeat protein [Planctomycetales bacterium]|nr:PQQ-binding-like beta-propeller repeat protein [Planctomycetales bacterium]NIM09260.1 PQQ-binding-like beta-propeller repeat protein [Planctomycetales bacterium]NIN08728.1 PQQ-binding-like beta-propeller repeat protein [Planctomycetales bacterium]NIN77846.1 PQQ-binding-like beta-propeller repeat protein [Planctomycetales bacterium]NIO35030.1 PQQ-binding-like beta-propeller repeat protein [Planctomycetales bacterium]